MHPVDHRLAKLQRSPIVLGALAIALAAYLLVLVRHQWGWVAPDLAVFLRAAGDVQQGVNPYQTPPGDLPYVSGPFLAQMLVPTSSLDPIEVSRAWLLFNLVLLATLTLLLVRTFGKESRALVLVGGLLVLSFPVRWTLGNGQVGLLVCLLIVAVLVRALQPGRIPTAHMIACGVALWLCLEFKPYLTLVTIAALLVARRFAILVTACAAVLATNALSLASGSSVNWLIWARALTSRTGSIDSGEVDQSSPFGILSNLMPGSLAALLSIAICGGLVFLTVRALRRQRKSWALQVAVLLALTPFFSPYVHYQDWLFSCIAVVAILLTSQQQGSPLAAGTLIATGLLLSWMNPSWVNGLIAIALTLALLWLLGGVGARGLGIIGAAAVLLQAAEAFAFRSAGWQLQYFVASVAALLLGVFAWVGTITFREANRDN